MARKAHQIIILGTNGTGKTTLVAQLVQEAVKAGKRALIVVADPVDWRQVEEIEPQPSLLRKGGFSGVRKLVYQSDKDTLSPIKDYYFDGLLIFDDCRAYLRANTPPELKNIFIRRRQFMRDIVIVGHGFTDVPPQFFTYTTMFILFKTVDNIERRKSVVLDYEKVKAVVERVNKAAQKNPHYNEKIII